MSLSPYHQKYLNRTQADIAQRIRAKEFELKQIFEIINYDPQKSKIKIAILGCGVKYFVSAHKEIFKKLLKLDIDLTTFDISLEHLLGEEGIIQHDCTEPLPNTPYDIVYSSILLKFIPTIKQWDLIKNSYEALGTGGVAIHLLGDEEANKIDVSLGYNNVLLDDLRKKIIAHNIDFKEINIATGPNLNHKELAWVLLKPHENSH